MRLNLKGIVMASLLGSLLALVGCDPQKIAKLEEGVATEADVRKEFGEPHATYSEADGAKTFEYSRQPEGQVAYMITIGTDGKMSALRQVLKSSEFAKIKPGQDKGEVRRLLGKPGRIGSLQRFLAHVQARTGVWICRRIDIARHWKATHPFDAATAFLWE